MRALDTLRLSVPNLEPFTQPPQLSTDDTYIYTSRKPGLSLKENLQICGSMDLRNNISALHRLCGCRVIDGHLHFVLQEQRDKWSVERLSGYTFPDLREITHHLLIYRVFNLTSLRRLFPNLAVIRGKVLFHNYALVIYDVPSLQEVGLVSLSVILRGSVRIERNLKLCYVDTVDWSLITANRPAQNYLNHNRHEAECPACPQELGCFPSQRCGAPRCWGPNHCQTLCRSECVGGCVGDQCCHEQCVGGCRSPGDPQACHACRNLLDQQRCTHSCSSHKFKVAKHRCERRELCSDNYAIKWDTEECVERCPPHYTHTTILLGSRVLTQCVPCREMACPRRCPASTITSISHAQILSGCTIIDGHLTIYISGGENLERELEEHLSNIEEITGFLKIFRSSLTSLSFLNSLTRIGGEILLHNNYSLVVLDNPNLHSLWNTTNLTVDNGKVFVQSNPKLCLHHIQQLVNDANITGLSETDVSSTSNGDKAPCNVRPLNATVNSSPLYGTLTVTVASTSLPPDTVYYVNYKKTDNNVSLYESEGPCSDLGWSTMEMGAGTGTIVSLEPYTRYAVYVKVYSLGTSTKGAQSDVLYAITSPYNPTEPVHLGWTSPNSSSLEVWWEPPRRPNGVIDHYLVTLTRLPDTHTVPPDLDFCNQDTRAYVDKNLVTVWDDDVSTVPERTPKEQVEATQEEEEEEEPLVMEGDNSCRVTPAPSCCACQNTGPGGDQEVIGLEDFITDSVYLKMSQRATRGNLFVNDEELQAKLWNVQQPNGNSVRKNEAIRVPKEDSAILHPTGNSGFSRLLSGQQEEDEELLFHHSKVEEFSLHVGQDDHFSFYQRQMKEFPLHQSQTAPQVPTQAGIQADYQAHEEDLTQHNRTLSTHGSALLHQVRMTRELRVRLHHLHHYSLYLVEVVACQAPTTVPLVVQRDHLPFVSKLCSSIPARVAAYTRPSGAADDIPCGSVRAVVVHNTSTGSVVITWAPPFNPNGGVVAYIYRVQGVSVRRCVSSRQFEEDGRVVELRDLSPGNYSLWVKVRSKVSYGKFSTPVFFLIPDPSWQEVNLVVISVVMMLAGAVVAAAVCCFWRRYKATYTIPDTVDKVDINPYYCEGFAPAEMFRQNLIFWRGDLKVLHDRPLGHGFFGMVFEGELSRGGQHTRVAVKTHSDRATDEEIRQFLKEAALMQNISCHHVVQLLGVVGDYSPVYVVMELMHEGDLKTFLKKRPPNFLTGQKMMEMAVEAADGMAYLAACKLVHRDLAARNCMLNKDLTLKIGDFGLSRNLQSDYYRKEGQGVLPVKWMAPESLQFSVYSTHSDVWSYGVLLWEMATRGVTPYKNRTNDEVIRLVVERYATLGRPRNCPLPLQQVMRRCWRYEPRRRPSFLSITKFLLKHTSAEYQQRFEGLSFYHSRYNHYSRYHQTERSGFMADTARESDADDHSDDQALMTSPELSDGGETLSSSPSYTRKVHAVSGTHHAGSGTHHAVSGTHHAGSGTHHAVSGTHHAGSGTHHAVSGTHHAGSGTHHAVSGTHHAVSGTHHAGSGTHHAVSGTHHAVSGTHHAGSGTHHAVSGTHHAVSGTHHAVSGTHHALSGTHHAVSGTHHAVSGTHHAVSGTHHAGSGTHHAGSGTHHAVSGTHHAVSGTHHAGSGTHHAVSGTHHAVSGTHHAVSGTHHAGSGTHHAGSGTHHAVSRTHHAVSGTHHAVSGTHHAVSGTHHAVSGTHHAGSGTHHAGSGTPHAGSGTHHAGSGTHHAGSGTHHAVSGTPHAGSGTHHAGSGTHHAESGTHHTGSGTHHASSGIHHAGSGTHHAGSGTHHAVSGTPHAGSGTHHTGSGTHHTGSGTHHASSGIHHAGSGTPHAGSGTHHAGSGTHHTGSGTHHASSGIHHAGSGTHHAGSGTHHAGSGTRHAGSGIHHAGSETHHTGSGTHHAVSGTHHAGSGTHHAGSGIHQAGSATHHAGSGTHHAGSGIHHAGSGTPSCWERDPSCWEWDPSCWERDPSCWERDPSCWERDPSCWERDPSCWEWDPSYWERDPSCWEQDPSCWERDPSCCEQDPSCCEWDPSCCERDPSCCERDPSCCERDPSCWERDPSCWERDPSCWERDPSCWERDPSCWERDPSCCERDPSCWERDPSCWERDPSCWERDPSYWERDPSCFERDPSCWERDPSCWEQDPSCWERDPSCWERDPSCWERDPSYWERDPSCWERDPSCWERDPSCWERDPSCWERDPSCWERDPSYWERDPSCWERDPSCWERDPIMLGAGPIMLGAGPIMLGAGSIMLGAGPIMLGAGSIMLGAGPIMLGVGPIILGAGPIMLGARPIMLGAGSIMLGAGPIMLGAGSIMLGAGSIMLGAGPIMLGAGAIMLGAGSIMLGAGSIMLGAGPIMLGAGSIMLGAGSIMLGAGSIMLGAGPLMLGAGPLMLGAGPIMLGAGPIMLGAGSIMLGAGPLMLGAGPLMLGAGPIMLGAGPIILGAGPLMLGAGPIMLGEGPIILGASLFLAKINEATLFGVIGLGDFSGRDIKYYIQVYLTFTHDVSDTPEKDFIRDRRTPNISSKSKRTFSTPNEPTSWSGKVTFGRTAEGIGEGQDLTVCGRWSGVSQHSANKHLYTNYSSDDTCSDQSLCVGRVCQGLGDQKGAGLPIFPTPQDYRELRFSQLHLGTPSTQGSARCSSSSLKPSNSPQPLCFNSPSGRCSSPVSPILARSLSSLTQRSLGSNLTLTNIFQSSIKFRPPSPNLSIPVYSNLKRGFSSSEVCNIRTFPTLPSDEGSILDIHRFFSEDTDRSSPSTTACAPSTPYNSQQQNKCISEPSVSSPPTPLTRHSDQLLDSDTILRDQKLTLDLQTSPCHTLHKPELLEPGSFYVNSNTSTSIQDSTQAQGSSCKGLLRKIEKGSVCIPSSLTATLRRAAAASDTRNTNNSPGDFEMR
nr:uncharacterized protein LOC123774536 [Procambarus clarkii]